MLKKVCLKHLFVLASFAVSMFFISCSSMNTFSEYNKSVDFNKYKTYSWIAPDDSSLENQVLQNSYGKAIMAGSNTELKKKGMILDNQNADVVFKYHLGINHTTKYSQSPTLSIGVAYGAPGYYYGGVAVPVSGGNVSASRQDEAFLMLEMYDPETGYILWTGGARKTVDNTADSRKNMQLALHAIFAELPVKHKVK
jgi:hypothetical protein